MPILCLFGGHSAKTHEEYWVLISGELNKLKPKQILHLGFARTSKTFEEGFSEFKKNLSINFMCEILDASKSSDIKRAKEPLIFVSGGHNHVALYGAVTQNKLLNTLVLAAEYYFGESAGAMLAGSSQRKHGGDSSLMHGLGILKSTVIEAHYSQRNKQELLRKEMKAGRCKYGIGIDEAAGIKIHSEKFPRSYDVIGKGKVEVIARQFT